MTPNFALSLSFEGIRLMHRVTGGWHLVDEVALDDPDLTGALARLRQTAVALEPSGLRTKILLPNDQIKYLSIDRTQTTIDDVRDALQGATPYAIDDLVIDFNRSGGRTHIAAVARETLSEAEAFARQHRFAPVAFAAVAEPFTFSTEVFFGMTSVAPEYVGEGVVITRDEEPVRVIGRATMPTPELASDAMPLTVQAEPASAPGPALEPELEPNSTDVAEIEADGENEPVLTFSRSGRQPSGPSQETDKATVFVTLDPIAVAKPSLPEIDEPVFTSRQRNLSPVDPSEKAKPETVFNRPTPEPVVEDVPAPQVAEDCAPAPPVPIVAAPKPIDTAPSIAPVIGATNPVTAPALETADQKAAGGLIDGTDKLSPHPKKKAAPAPPPTGIGPLGGQSATQIGGKPRFLGLMLTAGLLVFLALVALWASTLNGDGIAGLLGFGSDSGLETAGDPIAPTVTSLPDTPAPAPRSIDTTTAIIDETPPTPIVTTVPGRVLSPGEADRIYAATGVWQRAPRLPALPEVGSLDGLRSFDNVPVVAPVTRPRDLASAAASLDAPFPAPPNPAPAGTIIPRDENGFIVASADGTVMPNGVVVYAKAPRVKPPERPAAAEPEAAVIPEDAEESSVAASIAAAIAAAAAAETVAPDANAPDDTSAAVDAATETPPAADEPTLGAVRLAGLRPAVRPQGLAPEEPFANEALAGLRPALRPEGLAPPAEETPEEDVAEADVPQATANDIASVIATIAAAAPPSALVNPTSSAIVASPRPDTRPNNFSRVVASAQQNTARQQPAQQTTTQATAPAVASSAAARPSGAVPQSVASAATMDSVINLRNVNLIGVYGRPNDRRALIRLSNGSYVKVEVGSSLDGGRVTAIGDSALNYVVRGQTYALQLPSG